MRSPVVVATVVVPALLGGACASTPAAPGAAADEPVAAAKSAPVAVADDPPDAPPATFQEAIARFASECPAPFFTLSTPSTIAVSGQRFTVSGSAWRRETPLGETRTGAIVIGVVGAVKDAEPETRENLEKAAAAFSRAGATLVLVNGDVVGHETAALSPVTTMLDDVFAVPVVVHAGNYEWTSAFTETVAEHPGLINANLVRELDLGGTSLLSLPGYFNRRFLQPGACHYDDDDTAALTARARSLADAGQRVILTSHGPPLQHDKGALDLTADGEHVGDPAINALLKNGGITVGIFSHILEAGGRVTADVDGTTPLKLPLKKPVPSLYVNVGSASSFGWGMNDGTTSRGLAAIVSVDADGARVEMLKLR